MPERLNPTDRAKIDAAAVSQIRQLFDTPSARSKKWIERLSQDGRQLVLSWDRSPLGGAKPSPLEFKVTGTKDLIPSTPEVPIIDLDHFRLILEAEEPKATLFARVANPEPFPEHIAEAVRLMRAFKTGPFILAQSLPGAGASAPHHMHMHFKSLSYGNYPSQEGPQPINIGQLLESNIDLNPYSIWNYEGIQMQAITSPVWGVQLRFADSYTPEQIGQIAHRAIHRGVRYRSQLRISHNTYILADNPNTLTFLFRESRNENPFENPQIIEALRASHPQQAEGVLSRNQSWRWGWTEMIGWLSPKGDDFPTNDFDFDFWRKIYSEISLDKDLQTKVWQQIVEGIQKTGWAEGL